MKKITSGTWFDNPLAGQRSLLVKLPAETGGRYFEMEYICEPFAGRNAVAPHYHATYRERFQVLHGRARYLLDKTEHTADAGEEIVLPPRIVHIHPWSDSAEGLHIRMFSEADPPDARGLNANLNTGITLTGLARDGKLRPNGQPALLQGAVLGYSILPGACPSGLSIPAARLLLGLLAIVGRLAGYRVTYPEYGEV